MTEDEYYADGNSDTHCVQPEGAGGYLISNCAEHTIARLRAQLEKATAVVEAAKGMRSWYDKQMGPDGPEETFDVTLAEWEKVKENK